VPRRTREQLLPVVLDPSRLPTPPAVALQVVEAASRPNCDPSEIVAFLGLDPALCGKLLKAVNSCLYGLKQPVASVARAVNVLGLNTVRSLALGLSLPAVKVGRSGDAGLRDFWISSVGGAIMARELAVLLRRSSPDDELVAGLLRDLGEVLLRQAFPDAWPEHLKRHADRLLDDPCAAEQDSFGIDHADLSAELLRNWKLPDDLVEPIRYHHRPELLATSGKVRQERGELLHFTSQLVQLDAVAQRPDLLQNLLTTARDRFNLTQPALVEFLQKVAPKVESFAGVLNQDIGQCPDFAAILAAGAAELVNLTVAHSRDRLSGTIRASATLRAPTAGTLAPAARTHAAPADVTPMPVVEGNRIPDYRLEFAERFPEGGCRLGGYELISLLGRGAMGLVYKAYEPSLHRFVAIKMLAPALSVSEGARQRFSREARVAAAIQHENVVTVYAVRESAGVTYLAMEYVRGSCVETRIEQHGAMPVPLFVSTARQIAAGLAAAHTRGIVHRDVKPANILLDDDTGRVKLTDFGLARVTDDARITADGALIGTPFYMSPEAIQGEPVTPVSDLFSLGGVLYFMATGKVPFSGQTVAAVFNSVCSREPIPPRRLRANLPERAEALILRLLDKDPAKRCSDAAAVVAELSHGSDW
jgi:HD-like signal output (HDOD) protein